MSGQKCPTHRHAVYKMVDTCAGEFKAETPYFYSTFDPPDRKLPFVGVMDGDRTAVKEAISGSHTPAEYQALMK